MHFLQLFQRHLFGITGCIRQDSSALKSKQTMCLKAEWVIPVKVSLVLTGGTLQGAVLGLVVALAWSIRPLVLQSMTQVQDKDEQTCVCHSQVHVTMVNRQ